jgi:glycosyltransferase involved in cell wall biosynthesis
MNKRVLIIFPNEWLAYTPTVLNMVAKLSDVFEIKVLAIDDGNYRSNEINGDQFEFVKVNRVLLKLHSFITKGFGTSKFYQLVKIFLLFFAAKGYKQWADEVIAVDSAGLWISQKIFGKSHFMSLELFKDKFFQECNAALIESVIIQTQERYDYLFGNLKIKTFLVQNSPPYRLGFANLKRSNVKKAIFLGNANQRNGAYFCIEAMRSIEELSLTIKGTISSEDRQYIETNYCDLLSSNRLIIDDSYVKQEVIIDYLSQYYVGFCFYNLNYTDDITRFNFISVPSGKLFNYYAAGVPVVGSDMLGLKSVQDFKTGVLLEDLSTAKVLQALKYIDEHHENLSENCFKAAAHFDFDSSVQPFKDYLLAK